MSFDERATIISMLVGLFLISGCALAPKSSDYDPDIARYEAWQKKQQREIFRGDYYYELEASEFLRYRNSKLVTKRGSIPGFIQGTKLYLINVSLELQKAVEELNYTAYAENLSGIMDVNNKDIKVLNGVDHILIDGIYIPEQLFKYFCYTEMFGKKDAEIITKNIIGAQIARTKIPSSNSKLFKTYSIPTYTKIVKAGVSNPDLERTILQYLYVHALNEKAYVQTMYSEDENLKEYGLVCIRFELSDGSIYFIDSRTGYICDQAGIENLYSGNKMKIGTYFDFDNIYNKEKSIYKMKGVVNEKK